MLLASSLRSGARSQLRLASRLVAARVAPCRLSSSQAATPPPPAVLDDDSERPRLHVIGQQRDFAKLKVGAAPNDWEEFRKLGHEMVDFMADYYRDLNHLPVRAQVEPGYLKKKLPAYPPESPESWAAIMKDVQTVIMPGMTHWQHPRFMAFFPANSSPAAIAGDMLSDMFNCIGFSWIASPAATELETLTLDWLARALKLPDCFLSSGNGGGVIQCTASDATLVAMLAARGRKMPPASSDVVNERVSQSLVAYTSEQAHSSVQKAAMIAGLPDTRFRKIPTDDNFAMDAQALYEAIREDRAQGLTPFLCVATIGTTASCAVDPISDIAGYCAKVWLHVDAAYAGPAAICPEYQHLLSGLEGADSVDMNPHKWLLTNFDCSTMWVKDRAALANALSITPSYLRSAQYSAGQVFDYRDWQVPLGRRFRALKLWFVMRAYGISGLQEHIRKSCAHAAQFAELVRSDDRFEIVAQPTLGLVCFRLKSPDAANEQLVERVNATGGAFLIGAKLGKQYVIRFAVGSPMTSADDVKQVWELVRTSAFGSSVQQS